MQSKHQSRQRQNNRAGHRNIHVPHKKTRTMSSPFGGEGGQPRFLGSFILFFFWGNRREWCCCPPFFFSVLRNANLKSTNSSYTMEEATQTRARSGLIGQIREVNLVLGRGVFFASSLFSRITCGSCCFLVPPFWVVLPTIIIKPENK